MAVLATLLAPFFLYLSARTAIVGLRPPMAASLPPSDYAPLLRRLVSALADPRRPVPAPLVRMARSAVTSSPLAFEPFFVLSRQALDQGDLDRAIALMEESRRRRSNFLPTRLLLMAYYSQANRYAEALVEMDYALRSSEGVRRVVLPELVKVMRQPNGRRALAAVLARRPIWREEFVKVAQNSTFRPEEALDLIDRIRALRPSADISLERGLYLQALVKAGQAAEARAILLEGLAPAERARHQYVFDGSFTGRKAPQPFGWLLRDTAVGRAEIVRIGTPYLDVNYFGGQTMLLAEQVLALRPGTYVIGSRAKSDGGISAGELFWALACKQDAPPLAKIGIGAPQPAYRMYQTKVSVPASCPVQRLQLMADPGDVATTFNVQIAEVRVVPQ